jgi:hypothetical protein
MSAPLPPVEKFGLSSVGGRRVMSSRVVCGLVWSWVIVSSVALSNVT